jgi:hypothetical protein
MSGCVQTCVQVREAAGNAAASPDQSAAQQQAARDAPIQRYFQEQVLAALLADDPRDKLMAVTREVCALKVVEAQLTASLAAASERADASLLQSFTLQQALQQAQAKLAALSAGGSVDAPDASLGLQVGAHRQPALFCTAGPDPCMHARLPLFYVHVMLQQWHHRPWCSAVALTVQLSQQYHQVPSGCQADVTKWQQFHMPSTTPAGTAHCRWRSSLRRLPAVLPRCTPSTTSCCRGNSCWRLGEELALVS